MNTLHTFGCSFTAPYHINGGLWYRQYYEYKNNTFPPVWPNILSEKLGFSLNNYGLGGISNDEIFSIFCQNINKIKCGDIVIIGWSFKERFRIIDDNTGNFIWIVPNNNVKLKNISTQTIEEILINRGNQLWVDEVLNWEKLIRNYLDLIGAEVITWSFDKSFPDGIFISDILFNLGAETIAMETNNKINDIHMGEIGHLQQSEYFFNILNKQSKKHKII
jgi:hypothetical protein